MTDITQLAREAGFVEHGWPEVGILSCNKEDLPKLEQLLRDKFIAELGEPVAYKRRFLIENGETLYMFHDDTGAIDINADTPLYALKD